MAKRYEERRIREVEGIKFAEELFKVMKVVTSLECGEERKKLRKLSQEISEGAAEPPKPEFDHIIIAKAKVEEPQESSSSQRCLRYLLY